MPFNPALLISPSAFEAAFATVAAAFRGLPSTESLRKCRQLHALVLTSAPSSSRRFLSNILLSAYSKCGAVTDARKLFDRMPDRNIVSFNTMISVYARSPRHSASASIQIFRAMEASGVSPSSSTFSSLALALHNHRSGSVIHCRVILLGFYGNVCVQTSLLRMYLACGCSDSAEQLFGEMPDRDDVAWNSMLLGILDEREIEHGLKFYRVMMQEGWVPTPCTYTVLLSACREAEDLNAGRLVHGHVVKSEYPPDTPLQNALLDMYSNCGDINTGELVFARIDSPDLVSWNSLMAGFSNNGDGEKAMHAFVRLKFISSKEELSPDKYTFVAVISATSALPFLFYGKPLHAEVKKTGWKDCVYVGHALIGMYFMNGEPTSAEMVFNCVPEKDEIIWTEMVAGHSRLGEGELAIGYFFRMLLEGHEADSFSLSSAMKASTYLTALRQGEMLHALVVKAGYGGNTGVCGSLVDMYAKNGSLGSSRMIFDTIKNPDLICWNSIMGGYGNHGNADEVFNLFGCMVERGLQPDHVTYISLLSACSHSGILERGRFYWFCMMTDGIVPGLKHYTCMVNLLSRAGRLQEAEELITGSPFRESSIELWRILLSSAVVSKDLDRGVHAANQLLSMEPDDIPTHILLSNLYASVGCWDVVAEMRRKVRGLLVEKEPGLSWIESKNMVHVFSADDDCHEQVDDCRNELIRLQENLRGLKPLDICL
ncbi:Pentatricopeptide repeat-containing protein [Apostasia shenzhenica]|uniref:Pentatricopeptide repeat-containing protein n=1 Tax=Apostasia shenzhenica TaxID=1088818 RepID=A0A2H9ZXB0_9ASPA|nr:Pentatricopeptide repeat-containing protein [Apostasia shenzhenica]